MCPLNCSEPDGFREIIYETDKDLNPVVSGEF